MVNKESETFECAHCGHQAEEKFKDDICPHCGLTYWKCEKCGYLLTAKAPPEHCPSCKAKCDFRNVTCYTPECGGPEHYDPKLV